MTPIRLPSGIVERFVARGPYYDVVQAQPPDDGDSRYGPWTLRLSMLNDREATEYRARQVANGAKDWLGDSDAAPAAC